MDDGGELPGEVHRVADAGVHPLTADGAMDVRSIAEQEGSTAAKVGGYAMMDVIGRKPVHASRRHVQMLDRLAADVVERERVGTNRALVAHCANESDASGGRQRKDSEE